MAVGNCAPCQKHSLLVSSLPGCAKEIHTPVLARMDGFSVHGGEGNPNFRCPNVICGINTSRMLEAGIPGSVVKWIVLFFDFQVDPLVVWRYFEFVVVRNSLRLRIQEHFSHITIPEFPTLRGNIFALIHVQRVVATPKSEVNGLICPDGRDVRGGSRVIRFARHVMIELYPLRSLPNLLGKISVRAEIPRCTLCDGNNGTRIGLLGTVR